MLWPCWKKYVTGGYALGFRSASQSQDHSLSLLFHDPFVDFAAPLKHHVLMLAHCCACCHDFYHVNNRQNFWNVSQCHLNYFLFLSLHVMASIQKNKTLRSNKVKPEGILERKNLEISTETLGASFTNRVQEMGQRIRGIEDIIKEIYISVN